MSGELYQRAAALLARCRRAVALTGAGISTPSGIADFRTPGSGMWSRVDPEEAASIRGFMRDPAVFYNWFVESAAAMATAQPNPAHHALADLEERRMLRAVVTQNIDGLHHRAGSKNVIELHGRLDVARCTYCDYTVQTLDDLGEDPYCPLCHKRLRPGVVWFNEALPTGAIELAFAAAQRCDVFLVIGTSGVVQPAASLADAAKAYGARVIEVNPNPSELSYLADVCVRAGCRAALTGIDAAWRRIAS